MSIWAILLLPAIWLFIRSLYHAAILAGWVWEGLAEKTPPPKLDDEWARHQQKADAAERALLLASPTGWLLDPFRFPTDPFAPPPQQLDHHMGLWRLLTDPVVLRIDPIKEAQAQKAMVLTGVMVPHRPQATMRMKISIPDCPACGSGYTEIGAEHGGTASLYWCHTCHAEFTDKGETRKSKRRRKTLDDVMNELPEPPAHRD